MAELTRTTKARRSPADRKLSEKFANCRRVSSYYLRKLHFHKNKLSPNHHDGVLLTENTQSTHLADCAFRLLREGFKLDLPLISSRSLSHSWKEGRFPGAPVSGACSRIDRCVLVMAVFTVCLVVEHFDLCTECTDLIFSRWALAFFFLARLCRAGLIDSGKL